MVISMLIPKGLIPGSYTPWTEDEELDVNTLRERLESVAEGASGLHGPANHSEMCMLTFDEWKQWIDTMVSVAKKHGITSWAFLGAESMKKTLPYVEYAVKAGTDGIILHPPYKVEYSQDAAVVYFEKICGMYPDVPFMMYPNFNCPGGTTPALVQRLSEIPNVVGVKMTRRFNIEQAAEIYSMTRKNPHFNVCTGSLINMYALRGLGFSASFTAQSNYAHKWALSLWNALQTKNWGEVDYWYDKIAELHRAFNHPGGGYLHKYAGEKAAMKLLGRSVGGLRTPWTPPTEQQIKVISDAIEKSNIKKELYTD